MKLIIEFKEDGTLKNFQRIDDAEKKGEGLKNVISQYGRTFDSTNMYWQGEDEDDMRYHRLFVKCVQDVANEVLKDVGVLLLNDVYTMLGFDRTKIGAIVGWTYKKGNPDADDHVYIDIIEIAEENVLLLDFNVDGCVLQYLRD